MSVSQLKLGGLLVSLLMRMVVAFVLLPLIPALGVAWTVYWLDRSLSHPVPKISLESN